MDYKQLVAVSEEGEARAYSQFLQGQGIATKVIEVHPVDQNPFWQVAVYEGDFFRASFLMDQF